METNFLFTLPLAATTLSPYWYWIILGVLALGGIVLPIIDRINKKRKYESSIEWCRDIPLDGNLDEAYAILNQLHEGSCKEDDLLAAYILKLIQMEALGIEPHPNKDGQTVPAFVVKPWKSANEVETDDLKLMHQIYDIFEQAAGDDKVIEPKELKTFMENEWDNTVVLTFVNALHKGHYIDLSAHKDDIRQLLGLKKFLKEFTLVKERGMQEATLWKDYMVWATLFGCAPTVVQEMQKINPEYFKMDALARQMLDSITMPDMHKSFVKASNTAYSKLQSYRDDENRGIRRSSGSGGHASLGGGSGHSGGGSGGGIR